MLQLHDEKRQQGLQLSDQSSMQALHLTNSLRETARLIAGRYGVQSCTTQGSLCQMSKEPSPHKFYDSSGDMAMLDAGSNPAPSASAVPLSAERIVHLEGNFVGYWRGEEHYWENGLCPIWRESSHHIETRSAQFIGDAYHFIGLHRENAPLLPSYGLGPSAL